MCETRADISKAGLAPCKSPAPNLRSFALHLLLVPNSITTQDWPYCNVARRMIQMAASEKDLSSWNGFQWRRKMEAFGDRDESVVAVGATGDIEGIWQVS